jgi:uncharacterized protein with von Willebrand factor type A (vWA) domain
MGYFLSVFAESNSKRLTEDATRTQGYEYGNEPARIVEQEFALLANEKTKLLFFSKFADQSLTLHSPKMPTVSPVIMMLDTSGSMQGPDYAIAAGFVLAMCHRLHRDNRGCAIILFSGQPYAKKVFLPGQKLSLQDVLGFISRPDYGGTQFDDVLAAAYDLRDELDWRRAVLLMISDGKDTIKDPDLLRSRFKHGERRVAVLTQRAVEGLKPWNAEINLTSHSERSMTLTRVANSIL